MTCESCGDKPKKCNKDFTKAVIEIDNPEQITLMRKVTIPASMGDDTTVPPVVGKYHNVLLYYEANSKSYLYSSDGIPTQLVNGVTDYEAAVNLPKINGVTLLGDKSAADLELADAPMVITVAAENTSWSGADTAEDVYNFFLNKGKVNIVFNGGGNYAYEIVSAGYIPEEEKMMCTLTAATTTAGETAEFDGNALVGTMTLYTADKAIDVNQIDLQPKLYVADFTGLDLNYDTLSGVPATNAAIGMVKPGDGLEVASDGTLSISEIEQYAHFFDTVADMKATTNLVAGDYAKTLGYYSLSDEGGAYYKISSTVPSSYYETLASGLYAELVVEDTMNVKQFGAKGDGITDDTNTIQTAINYSLNIEIPSGTYMIDAETSIKPVSHSRIKLDKDATLKAITNSATNYYIIYVNDVVDVEISGGTIEGERDDHTGLTGEWGHCIYLLGTVTDVYIHDINLINAWGDGFCCNITGKACTERVHVDRARRNGFSIIQADSFISTDDFIENTVGTNPQCGVDIEPNNANDILRNIVFNNLYTKNNYSAGLMTALIGGNSSDNYTSIKVNNFRSDYDRRGLQFDTKASRLGDFTANNPVITNSTTEGILIDTKGLFPITINHPVIKYYRVSAASNVGLRIQGAGQNVSEEHGNIWINNAEITDPISTTETPTTTNWAMDISMNTATMKNIHVHNPVNLGGRQIRFNGGVNCSIDDEYKITKFDSNAAHTISRDSMTIYNTTSSYTTNRYMVMREDQQFAIGQQFHFINTGDYTLTVRFPGQHIYPLSSDTGKYVTLETKGSSMVIERINDDSWAVVSQTGTLTVTN